MKTALGQFGIHYSNILASALHLTSRERYLADQRKQTSRENEIKHQQRQDLANISVAELHRHHNAKKEQHDTLIGEDSRHQWEKSDLSTAYTQRAGLLTNPSMKEILILVSTNLLPGGK